MSKAEKVVSVVVPVYFNATSLPLLYDRLVAVEAQLLERHATRLELIFVNDGSRDGSWEAMQAIHAKRPGTKLINLSRNFGAVHCSRTGLRFCTGGAFIIVAADLQDPPELLLDMVPAWMAGHKFVIATRASRQDPLLSRFYSYVYYKLLRWLVVPGYPEGGFDMALMDRSLLGPMTNCSKNAFTPLLAYWLGFTPHVVTFHRPEREHGKSGWTFRKKFNALLDVMLGFSVTPIRVISGIGVVVALASLAYGGLVVVSALLGRTSEPGFASIVAIITFLLGVIIIMLGVVGEYLWRIFDEVNKRPETVIDEIIE